MEFATLGDLIETLERGTKLHICLSFLDECGNRKTHRTRSQSIHDKPVCMAVKRQHDRLSLCYRCRNTVQKAVIKRRKPMAGLCVNGVYEYCRPVVYNDRVICVIFIGNILSPDPEHQKKMRAWLGDDLVDTMEDSCSEQDCVRIADVVESYIVFLFDRYGIENKTFDPLAENIKNYIRENLTYGFTMEELAAEFNYTPKYLGHTFKVRTGKTIKEYSNQLKVEQAKIMLTDTKQSIETIAAQVGFNSVTYFDRVFYSVVKLSPQAYRATSNRGKKSGKA